MMANETSAKFMPPARAVSLPLDLVRERLTGWLRARFDDDALTITDLQTPGAAGVNNETLLLQIASSTPALAGLGGLVVRLEAPTTLFPGFDIVSSYKCYRAFEDDPLVPTPRMFGLEADPAVLGRPFYVMERIDGLIPADNPTYHLSGWVRDLAVPARRQLWENSIRTMARVHRAPVERFAFLREMGIGTPRQQMNYWRKYLDECQSDGRANFLLEKTWDWLVANFPADAPEGFAWGDARVPNLIYRGTQCVGLLDWDMVSLAGAECDLGWWLVSDIAGSAQVGRLEGLHDARGTVAIWQDESGRQVRDMEFWIMFNLFRLGAIMIRLQGFLGALGTPPETIKDMDRVNTAQSVLNDRWGLGSNMGLGQWSYLAPAIAG